MIASTLLYGGVVLALLGLLSAIRPLRLLRIHTRLTGLLLFVGGASLAVGTALCPRPLVRATPVHAPSGQDFASRLDAWMPEYHFSEHHEIVVNAPPERVYRAIKEVRPGEIRLFLLLTGLRSLRLGQLTGRDVPPLAAQRPILAISESGGFQVLAEEANREIVQGTCAQFWRFGTRGACPQVTTPAAFLAFREPGYAKATINFRVVPEGAASRVTTETRILATDDGARRRFGAYWRAIYPGSALIRKGWLAAIKRRAEGPSS